MGLDLTVKIIPGAPIETNCYFVADAAAGEALLVDAPWQVTRDIQKLVDETGVKITAIVLTHGHWDHTMGATELKEAFDAPVYIHEADVDRLRNPSFAPFNFNFPLKALEPDKTFTEGDTITLGRFEFKVLHTPGHTDGGICLHCEEDKTLFTGDTLFRGSYGRLDLGGNPPQMVESLCRLANLDDETVVYPGHGPNTTIGNEKGWLKHIEEIIEDNE